MGNRFGKWVLAAHLAPPSAFRSIREPVAQSRAARSRCSATACIFLGRRRSLHTPAEQGTRALHPNAARSQPPIASPTTPAAHPRCASMGNRKIRAGNPYRGMQNQCAHGRTADTSRHWKSGPPTCCPERLAIPSKSMACAHGLPFSPRHGSTRGSQTGQQAFSSTRTAFSWRGSTPPSRQRNMCGVTA